MQPILYHRRPILVIILPRGLGYRMTYPYRWRQQCQIRSTLREFDHQRLGGINRRPRLWSHISKAPTVRYTMLARFGDAAIEHATLSSEPAKHTAFPAQN